MLPDRSLLAASPQCERIIARGLRRPGDKPQGYPTRKKPTILAKSRVLALLPSFLYIPRTRRCGGTGGSQMPQIRYEHWCTLCIRPSMHDTKESQVCPRCRCSRTECKESK